MSRSSCVELSPRDAVSVVSTAVASASGDYRLETAHRIATRLVDSALWSGDECTWPASYLNSGHGDSARLVGDTIYKGTAGIALFLLETHRSTGDGRMLHAAIAALNHARRLRLASPPTAIGFYAGSSGVAYALAKTASCTDRDDLMQAAKRLAHAIPRAVIATPDVLGGSAGAILGLLRVRHLAGAFDTLDIACDLANNLMKQARRSRDGWSWGASRIMARDLVGLSHGACGIAHAFAELYFHDRRPVVYVCRAAGHGVRGAVLL